MDETEKNYTKYHPGPKRQIYVFSLIWAPNFQSFVFVFNMKYIWKPGNQK